MTKADLHIHSSYSDGSDSIEELLANIKKAKIEIFALTDHDTVAGCQEIQKLIPKNIKFIPSVFINCHYCREIILFGISTSWLLPT